MACVAADGTLTLQAKVVLDALRSPHSAEEVAASTDLPLFRIRGSLRELVAAGLLAPDGDTYQLTATGRQRLAEPAA
jgi:DNA-binding IclR family transcriptional regulator